MGSDCSSGSCETGIQGTGSACGPSSGRCGCGSSSCGGDPVECAISMWSCGFFRAMKEVQVDILKTKIQKAWGAKMEKAADAVVEAMGVQWQSMLAQGQAKGELRERLRGLWSEGKK